ncbi:LysR family transcriptional regulator [Halovulum dunhuangense]|uniref:LysR family transcriptional regulator n=1 Tax=Halovulum dunhuangense TaxID=1505036 RepID=A0A849L076_9RHOB|nr:LysR family transcriptional regulator [Halovulum dunhuangense]NNU79440.1 LysR family transcriptional regulator [Halovulum dunhuangense]
MAALNYNHLRYFWAVAHEGHLTRAAERLAVSQSALSVQIRKLEDQLGHPLFERRGKALHLTEAGRIALDHADRIFATGTELQATLSARERARQVLRVGALATLSRNFQIGFLAPLIGRPEVEVVLRSGSLSDLLAGLEAHRLDVVLLNQAPPRDAATPWIATALAAQPVSLIGTPARIAGRRDIGALLGAEPVLLPTIEGTIRAGFDALMARLGIAPRIAAEVDDMAMMRLLARADAGLAVVPPIVVRDELAQGLLVEAAPLPGIIESFFAVTLERRFPNPLLGELLQPHAAPDEAVTR